MIPASRNDSHCSLTPSGLHLSYLVHTLYIAKDKLKSSKKYMYLFRCNITQWVFNTAQ